MIQRQSRAPGARAVLSSQPTRRVALTAHPGRAAMTGSKIPALVAFDLDGTMWWPEMYMLSGGAPFSYNKAGHVLDSAGERVKLIGDTAAIFTELFSDPVFADTDVAYVSRTEYPEWALPCLKMFQVPDAPQGPLNLLDAAPYKEIYPGSKIKHFKRIHEASGIPYSSMIFFDNERINIMEVERLGVTSVYTPRGLTMALWKEGLAKHAARSEAAASSSKYSKGSRKSSTASVKAL